MTPIKIDIAAETQDNLAETRTFNSRVDDYDLAPNGNHIVFSIHGEIFTAPVQEGDLRQITDNPARDREARYSPDGKQFAFISDRSGREEIYLVSTDGGDAEKITDLNVLKNAIRWSPDSKTIVFTTSDARLYKYDLAGKQQTELAANKFGGIGGINWSPDGKWIACSMADESRINHVFLIPTAGGAPRKVTTEPFTHGAPRFSADGRKLYFVQSEGGRGGGGTPSSQIYVTLLERQDYDPADPEERPQAAQNQGDQGAAGWTRRPGRGAASQGRQYRLGGPEAPYHAGDPYALRGRKLRRRARWPYSGFRDQRTRRNAGHSGDLQHSG